MSINNNFVPLPQVNEQSEHVLIHELGLPVGLDIERLELNLPGTERIIKYGDVGSLCIFGYRGDTTERGFGVGGISADGSATAAGTGVISKAETHDSDVIPTMMTNIPQLGEHYDWKHAHVKINNAEIEGRIREDGDKWDRGPYDVFARAKYMNRSLKAGLADAARESILGKHPATTVMFSSMKEFLLLDILAIPFSGNLPEALGAITTWQGVMAGVSHRMFKNHIGEDLPPRQVSLGRKVHYDRLAASLALTRTATLIRARK